MIAARPAVRSLAASKIRELFNSGLGRADILPFWVGEPDEPTPEFIRKAGMDSIAAGETFDVAIAPPAATGDFAKAGKVDAGGLNVGRVGSGVTIRADAPVPAIANADDIKKAVLEADSIVFNRASTGLYFENLLKKMGVYEQVEAKASRYATGAQVMEHVLKGKGKEVGFGAITEILLYREKGLRYIGPLPAEIQNYTSYTASVMSAGTQKDAAQALVNFLGGPAGKPLFVAAGIE